MFNWRWQGIIELIGRYFVVSLVCRLETMHSVVFKDVSCCSFSLSLSLIIAILIVLPYHLSRLIKLLSESIDSFSSELHRETITSTSRKWIRSWFEWFDIGFLDGKSVEETCCVTNGGNSIDLKVWSKEKMGKKFQMIVDQALANFLSQVFKVLSAQC